MKHPKTTPVPWPLNYANLLSLFLLLLHISGKMMGPSKATSTVTVTQRSDGAEKMLKKWSVLDLGGKP